MNGESPAILYTGAEIITLESDRPRAEALATLGDRIVAVGTEDACREALAAASAVRRVDLSGRCLLPGFIDTHLHPIALAYFDLNADLRGVRSIAALQQTLRAAAARLPAGEWLVGLQLEDAELAERRLPTRVELDAACPDRPVVVLKHDGHSAAGNGAALAAAGIDARTPDPPGGHIERGADGAPTGPCRESAAQRLFGAVPTVALERLQATARTSFRRLSAHGITSAGVVLQTDDEGPGGAAGSLESLAMQFLLDDTPFSTYAILIGRSVDAVLAARATSLHDPAAGRRVGGYKIYADGTFGSCTASMREPFADRPDTRGYLTLAEDELFERMRAAHDAGLQICVHAIGDAAVERCVGLYERLLAERPRPDHRHRIEHASLVPPETVPRMARCGLHVSTQPLFIHSEKEWLPRRLGYDRVRDVYPLRALVDAGVVVGGASDAPVESTAVLHAIECCVTREGFETQQALTPLQALRLFTSDAARLQFEEREKGTLAPGKRADLVVLSANPLDTAPERIADIRVLRTVTGGRVVYDHEGKVE
ncbi:amidohydrolase [Candidatus Binatia bacterium]|nr:amidohydrolase [Candidatus Binatia bacterium]